MEAEFVCVCTSNALAPRGQGWLEVWGFGQPLIGISSDGSRMSLVEKIRGQRNREKREGYKKTLIV